MPVSIHVRNLTKSFTLTSSPTTVYLSEYVANAVKRCFQVPRKPQAVDEARTGRFLALNDVSFDIDAGEVVGVIGRNGAGKSTLLKILSRISPIEKGSIDIYGRVGSLLEVGTGFHPELTGRENVFLNGAVLGMCRKQIAARFDEIIAFAEVDKFVDTPVKYYSSGMYMRLAFSIAAHVEPDVLLVDEVLAVGDAQFQKKCIGKMDQVARSGRTVLFVSHNMGAVSELCRSALLLVNGELVLQDKTETVLRKYLESTSCLTDTFKYIEDRSKPIQIRQIEIHSLESKMAIFDSSRPITISIEYVVHEPEPNLEVHLVLSRNGTQIFCALDIDENRDAILRRMSGVYKVSATIPPGFLKSGDYGLTIGTAVTNVKVLEQFPDALSFQVENFSKDQTYMGGATWRPGVVLSPIKWSQTSPVVINDVSK